MENEIEFLLECNKDLDYGYLRWNKWRNENNNIKLNLTNANLEQIHLLLYNLKDVNFEKSNMNNAVLIDCDFTSTNLNYVKMMKAKFINSNLSNATLNYVDFSFGELIDTRLSNCILKNSNLNNISMTNVNAGNSDFSFSDFTDSKIVSSNLVACNLQEAKFINCYLNGTNLTRSNLNKSIIKNTTIYGITSWDVTTIDSIQENLIITNHFHENVISVDNLDIANFIYLISNNNKISDAIDNITSKVVLILGRFTKDRLETLNYIKLILKNKNYVPVLFDFEKPRKRDLTETISIIGKLSKFVVADLTDAKCIPHELSELIPNNPSLVIYPIIHNEHSEFAMFEHWKNYSWVKPVFKYKTNNDLNNYFDNNVKN